MDYKVLKTGGFETLILKRVLELISGEKQGKNSKQEKCSKNDRL